LGVSPDEATQISRFQSALGIMMKCNPDRMADLAQELAFFDEAHFDKFFKKFTAGVSPYKFMKTLPDSVY
jgi:hypothetical protein